MRCFETALIPPIMTTLHPSRILDSGPVTTLYVTIPARVVADSQFPLRSMTALPLQSKTIDW